MTISEKIEHIRRLLQNAETFPPVSETYLHRTETELGITFPEEFRIFYTEISDGLWVGVKKWTDENGEEEITDITGELLSVSQIMKKIKHAELLTKDFPFEKSIIWGDDTLTHPELNYGNILIANKDDEINWRFIINGKSYGTMWATCWAGALTAKKPLSFLDWLALWIKRPHGLENTKRFT